MAKRKQKRKSKKPLGFLNPFLMSKFFNKRKINKRKRIRRKRKIK